MNQIVERRSEERNRIGGSGVCGPGRRPTDLRKACSLFASVGRTRWSGGRD
jgi:hypothetical protein